MKLYGEELKIESEKRDVLIVSHLELLQKIMECHFRNIIVTNWAEMFVHMKNMKSL